MPYLEALLMLSRILAEYNNVLVGIHPSFRHTPPIAFFKQNGSQSVCPCPFGSCVTSRATTNNSYIKVHNRIF